MSAYLFKLFVFVVFSLFILVQYYSVGFHNESGTGYGPYLITLALAYGVYKFLSMASKKDRVIFSPLSVGLYALLHLFILCFIYFGLTDSANGGFILFFKIFGYLFLPTTLVLIVHGLGKRIIHLIVPSFEQEETAFRFLLSLGFGFVLLLTAIAILGSLGQYNIVAISGILIVACAIAYKEIISSITSLWTHKIELPNHKPNGTFFEQVNLPLISTEILFMILTFLISVNFINIVRPMPIGWDDLGVYMNMPQIMANNGTIAKWIGMMAWQTLTGIGFMFHSAPQAFFINQIGGILSIIVLVVAFGSLMKNKNPHPNPLQKGEGEGTSFINLPLLGATMFYAMPMVIFQQAKDMKLDPGLFFVSVIGIYGMIYLFLRYKENLEGDISTNPPHPQPLSFEGEGGKYNSPSPSKGEGVRGWGDGVWEMGISFFSHHKNLAYILIIGTIVGLAFAIKFTSLMLILGLLGVIFYAKLGLAGFVGYFALFVAVFTKGNLWTQLNVNYPKDDADFLSTVVIVSLILAVIFFAVAFYQHKAGAFKKALLVSLTFIIGVGIPVSPWLVKNISETGIHGIKISDILNGKGDVFIPDYTRIYTPTELKKIESGDITQAISSSGKSQNEDLGRYFGYEDGVNNYLKLPLNLTMQSNQPGEYTEITPFFLALIPVIFLFLAFKNPFWIIGLVAMLGFEYAYFFHAGFGKTLTEFFASKDLPGGYAYIAFLSFLPLVFFSFALDRKEKKTELFLLNLVFASFYVFLFVIAAYGIVWYGISMYFAFLLAILIGGWYLSEYRKDEGESKGNMVRFFGSIVFLCITGTYFFASSVPHGWANLKAAGFNEFKNGSLTQEEGIFSSHPDYFTILATLNTESQKMVFDAALIKIQNPTLKKIVDSNLGGDQRLGKLQQILSEVMRTDLTKLGLSQIDTVSLQAEARAVLGSMYNTVLYPSKDIKNTAAIYRIGTFLTYFIDNNRSRYYDDSLVMNFDKYFSDKDPNTTVDRMQKLGLKYLLVDLNAATIDKDPRHDLTRRFENLLQTFRSDKLELIQTDSLCLQIALEEKDPTTYLTYAGVNYESYKKDEKGVETAVNRGEKQFQCYNHILDLMKNKKITDTSYSYLLPLVKYLDKNPPKDQSEMVKVFQNFVNHGWLVLFRIK